MADTILKKWNSTTSQWEELNPQTTHTQIVASGTPDSTTYLRGDGTWATVEAGTTFDGGTITGNIEISNTLPKITFTDTDHNSDFNIANNNGVFTIGDTTNQLDRFKILSNGNVEIKGTQLDIDGSPLTNVGGALYWDGDLISLNGHTHDDRYYTETETNTLLAGKSDTSHTHTFASITSKPTTIAGYGITDAYTKTQTDTNISTAVSNLVASAPGTLDTLNELAAALGDDPNFATTVTNSIATKLPLAGGSMTGAINMNNNNINGVNQLSINDPGEGILWQGTTNVNQYIIDDASDNIMNFQNLAQLRINNQIAFHDGYHPNADKLTTARNIALTGAVTGNANFDGSSNISIATTHTADPTITLTGAVTGSGTMTNLGNVSIATTATADPTLTLNGDATGSATFTNLGNATLTVTVADDSHNHIISNVDGLQTALDGKLSLTGGTITGNVTFTGADGENALTLSGTSPTLAFTDTGSEDDFYLHINSNNFYILRDAGGSGGYGAWDSPYPMQLEGDTNIGYLFGNRIFADNYHPNADKLTTARNIALAGDVTGSANFDGSANISITATVADDSHNHIISNIDGLQTALDGKQPAGTYNTIIGTDTDLNTSGATIIDNIYVTDGVITSMGTRVLQASDINALQTASAPYYSPGEWSLLRYNTTYGWITVSNPSDVVYELIKDGQTTISSATTPTTVTMTVSDLADDQILAMEIHSVGTGSTYTTNIVYVKLGSAANNSNNAVMFPRYAVTTYGSITFLMVYRNGTNSISTNYVYYNNTNSTTYSADGIYIGRVWRLRGVVGD